MSAILLPTLASCKREETPEQTVGIDVSKYTVVRPDAASDDVGKIAAILKRDILSHTGAELAVTTDASAEGEYEILVGDTGRQESVKALENLRQASSEKAYAIAVTDKKIVIVGLDDTDTVLGVKRFVNQFVKTSTSGNTITAEIGYKSIETTGEVLYFTEDYDAVVLERTTDIHNPRALEYTCSYGKIIKLAHNGENNGMLLATHESRSGEQPPIYCSKDDGYTWEEWSRVADNLNAGMKVGYQSYIYELPADLGSYKEGTLLFSGCTYSADQTKMVLYASEDLGKIWTTLCNIDVGGGYNEDSWLSDGLWEPILMYEDGRLYCFYSDELENGTGADHTGGHNQRIVYKYTTDLVNWSDKYECTASETPDDRPGMVALTKMGNGKWALALEYYGVKGYEGSCPVIIKYADKLDAWDVADKGVMVSDGNGKVPISGPAMAWTPNGGDCGTLLLTSTVSRGSATGSDLFISFDYGETFIALDNPLSVDNQGTGAKCGYSAGFFVDEEGNVYYVNNPLAYKGMKSEKFLFAKIKIY